MFLETPRKLESSEKHRVASGFRQLRHALTKLRQEIFRLIGAQFPSALDQLSLKRCKLHGLRRSVRSFEIVQLESRDERERPMRSVGEIAVMLREAFVRLLRCS